MNDMLSFFQDSKDTVQEVATQENVPENKAKVTTCSKCGGKSFKKAKLRSLPTSFSKKDTLVINFTVYSCTSCGFSEMYAD